MGMVVGRGRGGSRGKWGRVGWGVWVMVVCGGIQGGFGLARWQVVRGREHVGRVGRHVGSGEWGMSARG